MLDQEFLLASPVVVIKLLAKLILRSSFWFAIGFSFIRIALGFFVALLAGIILAAVSARISWIETLLWPYMTVVKAAPVVSFIILCILLFNTSNLSVVISFLIVLPMVYANILQGIRSTDSDLLEMARVFKVNWLKKTLFIFIPHLRPYLIASCSVSLGMAWKAGIAAEVIGIPSGSMGEMLYQAKLYYSTADLFAWTVMIVLLSVIFEKCFLAILNWGYARLERS